MDLVEFARLQIQSSLDIQKTAGERNRLGQYSTPPSLAEAILTCARLLMPKRGAVRFLDPAFGTGAFYSALLHTYSRSQIAQAVGYEIDPRYGEAAANLWSHETLSLRIEDFTQAVPPRDDKHKPNLIICNPPYVRHHHLTIEQKERLQSMVWETVGIKLNGLAGLYCYFLLLCHQWMAKDAVAGWLIPSEFMDVNYGQEIKTYLLEQVTLLRVHRFEPKAVLFDDALVSSAVVWLRNRPPSHNHEIEFTYGGTLAQPETQQQLPSATLSSTTKWSKLSSTAQFTRIDPKDEHVKLSEIFTIKRGIATGANSFFVLTSEQVHHHQLSSQFLKPLLPSPRHLSTDEVEAGEDGIPQLANGLFLLSCKLPEPEIQTEHPTLWNYLRTGIEKGVHQGYLCGHRTRWYEQEERPPTYFLCTYMGRQIGDKIRPFRFILNHSNATALNVYLLLYPKPPLQERLSQDLAFRRRVWQSLQSIPLDELKAEGRVYGGGLYKLEPRELGNACIVLPTV